MGELIVRPAAVADIPGMARVHVQSWQETYRGIESDEVLDDPGFVERRERMWTAALSDERYAAQRVAVAELDGEIVGIASSGPSQDEDDARPQQLYVLYLLRAHHGSGAGQGLLDAVIGGQPASLWVEEKNPRARAFYRRNGFVEDGTVQPDGGFTEVRMVRAGQP